MGSYQKAKPNDEEDFRPMGKTEICSYPSCKRKAIRFGEAFVMWDSVSYSRHEVERRLPPMAKLDVVANPDEYVKKYDRYIFNFYLHPECAAEWGMHLIEDALKADSNVGRILRSEKEQKKCHT